MRIDATDDGDGIDEAELDEIEERARDATAGPWSVRLLRDVEQLETVAVSTVPDTGLHEAWPAFAAWTIVALTRLQEPRFADLVDGRWQENAAFIAHARSDVPRLVAEIRRLRGRAAAVDR